MMEDILCVFCVHKIVLLYFVSLCYLIINDNCSFLLPTSVKANNSLNIAKFTPHHIVKIILQRLRCKFLIRLIISNIIQLHL